MSKFFKKKNCASAQYPFKKLQYCFRTITPPKLLVFALYENVPKMPKDIKICKQRLHVKSALSNQFEKLVKPLKKITSNKLYFLQNYVSTGQSTILT